MTVPGLSTLLQPTSPLREAEDAVRLDTSKLNFEESERALLSLIQEKLK